MRSLLSKKHFSDLIGTNIRPDAEKNEVAVVEEEEEYDDGNNPISVTTHLSLKPAHSTERLDKEVVLRRIRHRKRESKIKFSAPQPLLNSKLPLASKSTAPDHNNSKSRSTPLMIKWADDAFAAP